jgi:hypothetical protein
MQRGQNDSPFNTPIARLFRWPVVGFRVKVDRGTRYPCRGFRRFDSIHRNASRPTIAVYRRPDELGSRSTQLIRRATGYKPLSAAEEIQSEIRSLFRED